MAIQDHSSMGGARPRAHGVRRFGPQALIAAVGLACYLNSFGGVFLFDDHPSITENAHIRALWPPQAPLFGGVNSWRPLTSLTFAVNYALSGLESAWSYHLFNLAIHLACAGVLFHLVRRVLNLPCFKGQFQHAPHLALAVSLLWVAHPLNTSAVTYIVQRAESLMALCFLLTLYCALRGLQTERPQARWLQAAVLACASGMACKQVMAAAPLVVLAFDSVFISGRPRAALARAPFFYAGLALTWLIVVLLVCISPASQSTGSAVKGADSWHYALTQAGVLAWYLRLAVWPSPLCADYAWGFAHSLGEVWPQAVLICTLLGGTVWALWRRHPAGFAGAAFFLILAPTSSVMPLADAAAEQRMYLPLAVLAGLLVPAAYIAAKRLPGRPGVLLWSLCALAVAGLSVLTVSRNRVYASREAFWGSVLRTRPENPRAHTDYASALKDAGHPEEALKHYTDALRLNPEWTDAHNNLAILLSDLKQPEAAFEHYQAALRINPEHPQAHANFGHALILAGRLDEAALHLQAALRCKPDYPEAHNNYGNLLLNTGHAAESIGHFKEALRLEPRNFLAQYNWGNALLALGRADEAAGHYREVLRLSPNFARAQEKLRKIESLNAQ